MLFQTAMPKSLSAISTDVTKPPTNLFPPASLTDLLILSKRSWKVLCAVCFLPSSIKPEQLPQSIGPPWSWSWDSLPHSRTPQAHLLSSMCLGSSAILSFPSVASVPGISAGRAGPHRLQRKRQSQWLGSQRHSYVWAFPWPRAACRHSQFCIPMEKEKENNNNLRNKIKKNWKSDWRSNLFFFFCAAPYALNGLRNRSTFIFKLAKKPERIICHTAADPTLRSSQRLQGRCHKCALTRLSSIRMSASNSCSPTFHFCCEDILTPPPPPAATPWVKGLNFCRSSSRRLSIPPAPANAWTWRHQWVLFHLQKCF